MSRNLEFVRYLHVVGVRSLIYLCSVYFLHALFSFDQQPEGGVKEGDTFLAPLPADMADGPRIKAPTGQWKDGLFNCFGYGILHPSLCCSLWCTQSECI